MADFLFLFRIEKSEPPFGQSTAFKLSKYSISYVINKTPTWNAYHKIVHDPLTAITFYFGVSIGLNKTECNKEQRVPQKENRNIISVKTIINKMAALVDSRSSCKYILNRHGSFLFRTKIIVSIYPIACLLYELGNRMGLLSFSLSTQLTYFNRTDEQSRHSLLEILSSSNQHPVCTCFCILLLLLMSVLVCTTTTTATLSVYFYNYFF